METTTTEMPPLPIENEAPANPNPTPAAPTENAATAVDLNNLSIDELQALLNKKKALEATKNQYPSLGIDFNNPKLGDLVKFVYANEYLPLGKRINNYAVITSVCEFPGSLKPYCTLYDSDEKITTDLSKVDQIKIFDVDLTQKRVIDELVVESRFLDQILDHIK